MYKALHCPAVDAVVCLSSYEADPCAARLMILNVFVWWSMHVKEA